MRIALVAIASLCIAGTSLAQGSLSTQGFGYPPGQMSSRAEGMGGGPAELDPFSALNPASLADGGPARLYFQYDPEFRTVSSGGNTSKSTTARFPLVSFSLPINSRLTFGMGASTLVDRSSLSRQNVTQTIDTATVVVDQSVRVLGAIDDVRFALGYAVNPWLRVGVGAHIITGTNQLIVFQRFPDSTRFANLNQTSRLAYSGSALSGGIELHPSKGLVIGLDGRKGGSIRAESGDTLKATAHAPDHYGASIEYGGWSEITLAFHVARDQWTAMRPLASSAVTAYNSLDVGGGAEAAGPRIFGRESLLRLGVRQRTLPFSTTGTSVSELSIGGGLGIDIAPNRASLDLGLLHAGRNGGSVVKEHAYILSVGLRVVP